MHPQISVSALIGGKPAEEAFGGGDLSLGNLMAGIRLLTVQPVYFRCDPKSAKAVLLDGYTGVTNG